MAESVADEGSDDDFDGDLTDSEGNLNDPGGDVGVCGRYSTLVDTSLRQRCGWCCAEFRVNSMRKLTISDEFSL